jgi:hypothetical protein
MKLLAEKVEVRQDIDRGWLKGWRISISMGCRLFGKKRNSFQGVIKIERDKTL